MADSAGSLMLSQGTGIPSYGDGNQLPVITHQGAQTVVSRIPTYAEMARFGRSYVTYSATAVAPVAAMPTTAAHFVLWNGEAAGGKSYIIQKIGTQITTSAGAAINLGLAAHVGTGTVSTTPTLTAATIRGIAGQPAYGGLGAAGDTVTIVNDGVWHPVGQPIICANTANIMLNVEQDVNGLYIVKPKTTFSLASLCNAAGSAVCKIYVVWTEIQIDLA